MVPAITPRIQQFGDGLTTEFFYTFPLADNDADLKVSLTDNLTKVSTPLVLNFDYRVDLALKKITFLVPPTAGQYLTAVRATLNHQPTDYIVNGPLNLDTLESDLDRLSMAVQELQLGFTHTLRTPLTDLVDQPALTETERADKLLGFDASGNRTLTSKQDIIDGLIPFIPPVAVQMSITSDPLGIKLVGDVANPGVGMYYGTDGAGVRGWLPNDAGGSVTNVSVIANNGITRSVSNPTTNVEITLGLGNITVPRVVIEAGLGGILPAPGAPTSQFQLYGADAGPVQTHYISFGNGGVQLNAWTYGGTRALPVGVGPTIPLIRLSAEAYNGASLATTAQYTVFTDGAQTGVNRGAYHLWAGTPANTTVLATWMTLQNANLDVAGNVTALRGNFTNAGTGTLRSGGAADDGIHWTSLFGPVRFDAATGAGLNMYRAGVLKGQFYWNDGVSHMTIGTFTNEPFSIFTNNIHRITISGAGVTNFSGVADSASSTTGTVTMAGGLGVAKNIFMGTGVPTATVSPVQLNMGASYSSVAGANTKLRIFDDGAAHAGIGVSASQLDFNVSTGFGFGWYINSVKQMGMSTAGQFQFLNATDSTSPSTGSVTLAGGMGVALRLHVGTALHILSSENIARINIRDASANAQLYLTDGVAGNGYGGGLRGYSVGGQGGYVALGTWQAGTWRPHLTIDYLGHARFTGPLNNRIVSIGEFDGVNARDNELRIDTSGAGNFARLAFFVGPTLASAIQCRTNGSAIEFLTGSAGTLRASFSDTLFTTSVKHQVVLTSGDGFEYSRGGSDPARLVIGTDGSTNWYMSATRAGAGGFLPIHLMTSDAVRVVLSTAGLVRFTAYTTPGFLKNDASGNISGGNLSVAFAALEGALTVAEALNNLLPNQATNAGKVLTSDGTNATWQRQGGYSITANSAQFSPADSTTYYFGIFASLAVTTVSGTRRQYIPKTGTIRAATLNWLAAAVAGSGEAISMYVRVNDLTDYLISTVSNSSPQKVFQNFAMDVPVVAGDYIEIKLVTPAWALDPTQVTIGGSIFVE